MTTRHGRARTLDGPGPFFHHLTFPSSLPPLPPNSPDDRESVTQRLHALFLVPMQPPSPSAIARWEEQQQQGVGLAPGLAFLEQLPLPAPHRSATIRIRFARRHPDGWVAARLRMRRGREGIICSFAMMEGAGAGETTP